MSEVRLARYDLSGKLIETQKLEAANSTATINIQNLSIGTYLVALEFNDRILLRGKLVKD